MKRFMIIAIPVLVVALVFIGCKRAQSEQREVEPTPAPTLQATGETISAVTTANNDFGFRLFNTLASEKAMTGKNVIISPVSITQALCMTYNGAAGDTKSGMEKALGLTGLSLEEINAGQSALLMGIASADAKVTTNIANALWVKDGYALNEGFVARNRNAYQAEVSNIDVTSPAGVARINEWVSRKTEKMIPKLLSDNDVSADTRLILTNAVYFHGQWTLEFDDKATRDQSFTLEDGATITIPMMHLKKLFRYSSTNDFQAVRLPYGEGRMAMYLFLPAKGKTVADLLPQLTATKWREWLKNFRETEITVALPRFKAGYKSSLNDQLAAMGMADAFSDTKADFSGIPRNGSKELSISKVVHEAVLEVEEKGTRAAAATGVIVGVTSVREEKFITFDRPFLFAICDDKNDVVLFLGKIARPEKM